LVNTLREKSPDETQIPVLVGLDDKLAEIKREAGLLKTELRSARKRTFHVLEMAVGIAREHAPDGKPDAELSARTARYASQPHALTTWLPLIKLCFDDVGDIVSEASLTKYAKLIAACLAEGALKPLAVSMQAGGMNAFIAAWESGPDAPSKKGKPTGRPRKAHALKSESPKSESPKSETVMPETSALPKASLLPKMPPVKMPQVGKTFVFNYRRIINSETRIVAATEEDAKAIFSLGQWALDGNETTEEEFESISFREVQDS
jgi:hypothetical protein